MLNARKSHALQERDDRTVRRFEEYVRRFQKQAKIPAELRTIVARFVAVSDRGTEATNIFRYSEIIACCTRYSSELLSLELVDQLCAMHKEMVNGLPSSAPDSHPEKMDARLLMEAINTLEACRRVDNVTMFYEKLCTPSISESAKELTTMYQKLEFGKRAMLRHIFQQGDQASTGGFAGAMADEELAFQAKIDGKPPPGSSAHVGDPERPMAGLLSSWGEDAKLLALAGGFIALLVGAVAVVARMVLSNAEPTQPPEPQLQPGQPF